tara:strand:+ start:956 stop:1126 length:171 start_codon:yes stop_codon:yes gene_type:complete
MDYILEDLERIIDDIETDDVLDRDEIVEVLTKLKDDIEEWNIRQDNERTLEWDDLD